MTEYEEKILEETKAQTRLLKSCFALLAGGVIGGATGGTIALLVMFF